jgi:hypothetical protein
VNEFGAEWVLAEMSRSENQNRSPNSGDGSELSIPAPESRGIPLEQLPEGNNYDSTE